MDDPLFYVRALHFAATLSVAGVVFFIVGISEPALRDATDDMRAAFVVRSRLAWMAWISLVLALLSGVPWLALTAESMSGEPLGALSHGVLWTVLSQTDFGNDWLLRFVVACLLGGVFVHFLSAKGVDLALAKDDHGALGRARSSAPWPLPATRSAAKELRALFIRPRTCCILLPRRPGLERSFPWRWC